MSLNISGKKRYIDGSILKVLMQQYTGCNEFLSGFSEVERFLSSVLSIRFWWFIEFRNFFQIYWIRLSRWFSCFRRVLPLVFHFTHPKSLTENYHSVFFRRKRWQYNCKIVCIIKSKCKPIISASYTKKPRSTFPKVVIEKNTLYNQILQQFVLTFLHIIIRSTR